MKTLKSTPERWLTPIEMNNYLMLLGQVKWVIRINPEYLKITISNVIGNMDDFMAIRRQSRQNKTSFFLLYLPIRAKKMRRKLYEMNLGVPHCRKN